MVKSSVNPAVTKKLQAEISKLKVKLAAANTKLKVATHTLKQQKKHFKAELTVKLNTAAKDALANAHAVANKKINLRDKLVADAVAKFEKTWAKKHDIVKKAKVSKKKGGRKAKNNVKSAIQE